MPLLLLLPDTEAYVLRNFICLLTYLLSILTFFLSDVAEGGETIFPRWNGAPFPQDLSDCSTGLKVKPQKGKVIIFYNLLPDGEIDELSLHGACPVKDGVKWAANKWIWNDNFA